jgi:hypothetical protein
VPRTDQKRKAQQGGDSCNKDHRQAGGVRSDKEVIGAVTDKRAARP